MKKELLKYHIPNHVAIIMDGNGRWAKKRNKSRIEGHITVSYTHLTLPTIDPV